MFIAIAAVIIAGIANDGYEKYLASQERIALAKTQCSK